MSITNDAPKVYRSAAISLKKRTKHSQLYWTLSMETVMNNSSLHCEVGDSDTFRIKLFRKQLIFINTDTVFGGRCNVRTDEDSF